MKTETIVLAGGCFWGVEELLRKVPGVVNTEVGYTGGHTLDPIYEDVKTGETGHAESVKIEFDSEKLPLPELLRLFFEMHDPTTLNRQGNDVGTQYRSAIFYNSPEQKKAAEEAIARAAQSGLWSRPITTTVEPLRRFYSAEEYHQDYLQKNPGGYNCHYWRREPPQP